MSGAVDAVREQTQNCVNSRPGPKPSQHREALRKMFPDWSDRAFSTYYTALVQTIELKRLGGPDIAAEALQLAIRPNGSVNVSKFARVVEVRILFWLIDQPRAGGAVTRAGTKTIRVRVLGAGTTEFDGPGVLAAINTLGVPYMRSRHGKAWQVPGRHTDDLMALLEHRRYRFEVTL